MRYVSRKVGGSKVVDARGCKDEGDRMSALQVKRKKAIATLDAAIKKRDRKRERLHLIKTIAKKESKHG